MNEMENSWFDKDIDDIADREKIKKRKETQEVDYSDKIREREKIREKRIGEFRCVHCREFVSTGSQIGTEHRNHCPLCLWSQHVDLEKSGDRKSECKASMEPIGLTFKQEGLDKWGKPRRGELMIIHRCTQGDKISINRIAGDDDPQMISSIFEASKKISSEEQKVLDEQGIRLLGESDEDQVFTQLFGKDYKDRQAR